MIPTPAVPPLEIYLLGLVDFEEMQRFQRRLVYDLGEGRLGGALVLCEHPPTISVGRSGSRLHIRPDDEELRASGIRVHWVNRGGGCQFHLPGQLVVYLALPLSLHGLDLQAYLDGLQRVILDVLADFDLKGEIRREVSGVFLGHGRVASIGVAVSRWIAYHGFTLNVGPYLGAFELLEEPGIGAYALSQTSIESRRARPAPMSRVRESVIQHVESVFGLERHHVFTDHPMVRRKASPHVHVPSVR